jgi:ribosomal protein L32
MPTTNCTSCGKLYESGSEEQANEPSRLCRSCFVKQRDNPCGTSSAGSSATSSTAPAPNAASGPGTEGKGTAKSAGGSYLPCVIPTDLGTARNMMNCLPFAEPEAGIKETQVLILMMIKEIEALREHIGYEGDLPKRIKCPECGVYDTGGSVCEGCEAYREHQS